MKSFINQHNFPYLWLAFQRVFGGNKDKQRLAIKHLSGQSNILEIGCSVGNVSAVFINYPNINFTGIDIDPAAIELAKNTFVPFRNFAFECKSLASLAAEGKIYDYILFANILHHVDDEIASSMLINVKKLMSSNSLLVIMEPEEKRDNYNLIFKLFYILEQGEYRRQPDKLIALVKGAGLDIDTYEEVLVCPDSLPNVPVGRISLIVCKAG